MANSDDLSRLSCSRCKARKVKCNRALPNCRRCETHNLECVYPQRVKRNTVRQRSDAEGPRGSDEALAAILERLRRVEDRCTSFAQRPSPGPASVQGYEQTHLYSAPHIPSQADSASNSATPSGSGWVPSESTWTTPDASLSPNNPDVVTILNSSIHDVQKQILRQTAKSAVNDFIHIPKDLAKTWVEAFFLHRRSDMFVSLIDRRLIELMPELIEMENVHVDAAITLIYYTVLYHGCGIASSSKGSDDFQYFKAAYVCCLRTLPAWQRETTGTTTDLIAALAMALVCADSFDYDLAWQMYKYVCEYVQRLDLQNLDAEVPSTVPNKPRRPITDNDRKGFWELVQLDLLFQLIFDKPPSITATPWKVDMPWLRSGSHPDDSGMATTVFLAGSRIAFVLMRFFAMLDAAKDESREVVIGKTEELCGEVNQLFMDGHLRDCAIGPLLSSVDTWCVIDVTLTGYIGIIFMFRKAIAHGIDSPDHSYMVRKLMGLPLAVEAARNTIRVSASLLKQYPLWPDSVNALFGAFQIHVPYAMIVNAALGASDPMEHAADVAMLRQINQGMANLAAMERAYAPLAHALETVDAELRRRGI